MEARVPYAVVLTESADKQLKRIRRSVPKSVKDAFDATFAEVEANPFYRPDNPDLIKKIGSKYIQVGYSYRIAYTISQNIVTVFLVGDRRDFYERLRQLS